MRVSTRVLLGVGSVALTVALASPASGAPSETARPGAAQMISHVTTPTRGHDPQGVPGQARTTAVKTSNGISYHGGPVFTTAANVYFIWPGTIAVTLRRCNTAAYSRLRVRG